MRYSGIKHAYAALLLSAFLGLAGCASTATPARDPIAAAADAGAVEIEDAVHILGFDQAAPNSAGRLAFRDADLVFSGGKANASIPFAAIRRISIERSSKGLLRGTKGKVASLAPQGVGQVYNLFRPGAETLTILYVDRDQALHGAVVLLPKDGRQAALQAFARAGVAPAAGPLPAKAAARAPAGAPRFPVPREGVSVRVALPATRVPEMPEAYVAAIYEELVARLEKDKAFKAVWRQGDLRADPAAFDLSVTITRAKKGDPRVRGAIPVVGMVVGKTLIEADVRLADASGATVLDDSFKGSKRTSGESIDATRSLARRVARALEKQTSAEAGDAPPRTEVRYGGGAGAGSR